MTDTDRMKITDMNIDCLDAVLDFLEFKDLINAASSNKRINHAAKFVFIRKYNKKNLRFDFCVMKRSKTTSSLCHVKAKGNTMIILSISIALPLLRCFGRVIHKIRLSYSNKFRINYITSYINQFCTESLIEIKIWDMPKGGLDYFSQPFTRIEKVSLHNSEDQHELAGNDWLNRIFPKMKQLDVGLISKLFDYEDIVNHFPCLECLEIKCHENLKFDRLTAKDVRSKNIISSLKLNPQLKKFIVECSPINYGLFDVNILECTEDSLQNLESLVLNMRHEYFFRNFNHKIIYLKNVKYLEISFLDEGYYRYSQIRTPQPKYELPFSFDILETFIFKVYYFEYFCRFIEMCPTILTLGLNFRNASSCQNWERLVKICPSVKTINCTNNVYNCSFGIDAILNIIAIFKSLKCITFEIRALSKYLVLSSIKPIFNDDWLIFINETGIKYNHVEAGYPYPKLLNKYNVELKKRI